MATSLPILHKSYALENLNDLSGGERWQQWHRLSKNGKWNRNSTLERFSFFGDDLPMSRKAFYIQGDCFNNVFFGLFEIFSLTVASGQRRHMSDKATFWGLFVENCVGKLRFSFLHDFILDDPAAVNANADLLCIDEVGCLGGLIVPFVGIKLIDWILVAVHLV